MTADRETSEQLKGRQEAQWAAEGNRKRERVRFVRRFGLNLSDQILNSLETLHGSQFTDRSAVPPTFRRRTSWARSTSGA